MTEKIWPNHLHESYTVFSPVSTEVFTWTVQVLYENGEFIKRSVNNENVIGS